MEERKSRIDAESRLGASSETFHGNTRLPYGLCKEHGIDTTDMTPSEAWEALKSKTGITPKEAYEKLEEENSADRTSEEPSRGADKDTRKVKPEVSEKIIPAAPIITDTKIPVKTTPRIEVKKLKTLRNAQKKRDEWATKHQEYAPYAEQIVAGVKYLLDSNEFCINFDAANLEGIIRKGFLNQIQTALDPEIPGKKKTHGAFSPRERCNASNLMFGTPTESSPEEYEKYGYVGNPLDIYSDKIAPGYGDCTIILKKDRMKERTTYSIDDSLGFGSSGWAVPGKDGDNPSWEGAGFGGIDKLGKGNFRLSKRLKAIMEAPDKKSKIQDVIRYGGAYIELQFHGPLTMSDVDSIAFRSPPDFRKYVTADVKAALDALGVKLIKLWELDED